MARIGLFTYGSLVAPESTARTLGRRPALVPTTLRGWRRRWSGVRDNLAVEKTFADGAGELPRWILGLNLEPQDGAGDAPNGALIEVTEEELERLDRRELRYRRVDVTGGVDREHGFDRVLAYSVPPAHFAPTPPRGAVILASYLRAVESAFERLGQDQLLRFRRSTGPPPVEAVEANLVRDRIPPGNPRGW
jgi:hypothetical protein